MQDRPPVATTTIAGPLFSRWNLLLLAVVGLAFALRLAWALHVEVDPRTAWRWDMTIYDFQAYNLAGGHGFNDFAGNPTAHWPPGYPLALAPLYLLTDDSLLAARLLNVVLGTLTVVLVYLLGAKAFDRRAGLVGAGVLAAMPGQIFAVSLIMTEVVFTFLVILILTIATYALFVEGGGRLWQALIVGLLIGAATLVRGEALLLVIVIPAMLLFRKQPRRMSLVQSSMLVLSAAVLVLPWTARNVVKMHAPIIISTSASEALWVGHHEGANGRIAEFTVPYEVGDIPNPDYEVEVNEKSLEGAIRFAKNNPIKEITLVPRKFVGLYVGDGSAISWHDTPPVLSANGMQLATRLSDWYYYFVAGVVVLGFPAWLSLRDRKRLLPVAVVACWTLLFSVVFFGDERFHFAIMPIFCLWTGVTLMAAWDIAQRRWRREPRL